MLMKWLSLITLGIGLVAVVGMLGVAICSMIFFLPYENCAVRRKRCRGTLSALNLRSGKVGESTRSDRNNMQRKNVVHIVGP